MIPRPTAGRPRDHMIYSLVLVTSLRLAEIVGLNVGDIFAPDGTSRSRVRIRPEIAKGGRGGDVFLPDALLPKLRLFWAYKRTRGEGLDPGDPLLCSQSGSGSRSGVSPILSRCPGPAGGLGNALRLPNVLKQRSARPLEFGSESPADIPI